ncbi:MAG: recombinase family protein, partial [Thiotrichaceae bacterium]
SLKILNMGLDTNSSQGRLMMGILSSVAEFERELIKERQADGIAKAKASGKHLGRPKLTDEIKTQVMTMLKSGSTKKAISEEMNLGMSTIYKIQKEIKGATA